jgi:hypothetical protein
MTRKGRRIRVWLHVAVGAMFMCVGTRQQKGFVRAGVTSVSIEEAVAMSIDFALRFVVLRARFSHVHNHPVRCRMALYQLRFTRHE